jgi:flagella basal body P-ring formation protein FlgA
VPISILGSDSSVKSKGCTISSYKNIYHVLKKGAQPKRKLYKSSTCPAEINQKFTTLLLNYSGKIKGAYLASANQEVFNNQEVKITPEWITINSLKDMINSGSVLPKPWFLSSLSMIGNSAIASNQNLHFDFNCINCDRPGNRSVKMEVIYPRTGRRSIHWLSGVVGKTTQALVAINDIGVTNQQLSSDNFKLSTVTATTGHSFNYFLDQKGLRFYKLNKSIIANQPLRSSDLIPIPLIQMGDMVKTTFKKSGLTLRGVARATQRGERGDLIQLRSVKGNQQLMGKVIDYKQVEVQL